MPLKQFLGYNISMNEDLQKIIEDGVNAPSGENCQPWKFIVKGNTVSIFNIPEADTSLYNSKQKGSFIAHGALIETMSISAAHREYRVTVSLFPQLRDDNHVADMIFERDGHQSSTLYHEIFTRCTNRKSYTGEKLLQKDKDTLIQATKHLGSTSLILIEDEHNVNLLGNALGVHERVLFENKTLHDFFYGHILWDKEDEDKAGGFYIDTLEFLPHQLKAVKLFKSWLKLSVLNKILGVSKMIGKENGEKYAKSGTIGAVTMKGYSPQDYLEAGRSIQRMWLTATSLGLSVHPCNGVSFLVEYIQDTGGPEFSKKHIELLEHAYQDVIRGLGSPKEGIAFVFRIGIAAAPSAHAKRLKPAIEHRIV